MHMENLNVGNIHDVSVIAEFMFSSNAMIDTDSDEAVHYLCIPQLQTANICVGKLLWRKISVNTGKVKPC